MLNEPLRKNKGVNFGGIFKLLSVIVCVRNECKHERAPLWIFCIWLQMVVVVKRESHEWMNVMNPCWFVWLCFLSFSVWNTLCLVVFSQDGCVQRIKVVKCSLSLSLFLLFFIIFLIYFSVACLCIRTFPSGWQGLQSGGPMHFPHFKCSASTSNFYLRD